MYIGVANRIIKSFSRNRIGLTIVENLCFEENRVRYESGSIFYRLYENLISPIEKSYSRWQKLLH